ncbi:MAG: D-glycero-beta-D-manno-heptose 1,7-bisphosphate 7-phosphatase [Succinivibrionaceae bacterium]
MIPAIFLDRDGVINKEYDYVHTIDDFEFIERTIEALKIIKEKGYAIVIVTNQSGIARGLYTEEDFLKLTEWMDWTLQDKGIILDGIYYCPHHPTNGIGKYKCECNCRKPKPGMILESARDLKINLKKSYMVGDQGSDIDAGISAGITNNYLIESCHKVSEEDRSKAKGIFKNLYEFAKFIPALLLDRY